MTHFMKPSLRHFLLFFLASIGSVWAQSSTSVDVFKNPTCGCCGNWVEHMRQSGFQMTIHEVDDVSVARRNLGMPQRFASCHIAKIGGYLIEGHVPAKDLRRLLKERPKALGLAVPSMPPGSPGMETAQPIPYNTLLVLADGTYQIFAQH